MTTPQLTPAMASILLRIERAGRPPLHDGSMAYADHLHAADVPVQLELYRGVTHDFIKLGRVIKEAGTAMDDAAAALRQVFAL